MTEIFKQSDNSEMFKKNENLKKKKSGLMFLFLI